MAELDRLLEKALGQKHEIHVDVLENGELALNVNANVAEILSTIVALIHQVPMSYADIMTAITLELLEKDE